MIDDRRVPSDSPPLAPALVVFAALLLCGVLGGLMLFGGLLAGRG